MDIGAADVYLQPSDLVFPVEESAHMGVLFRGKAADIGHDRLMKDRTELWKFLLNDPVHARILKPDRIQHSGGRFGDPRGRVSEARPGGGPFKGKCSELIDIIKLRKLISVAEGPARRDHGVVEPDPA